MAIVLSKSQSFHLYQNGEYGNALRQWGSLGALLDSGFKGLLAIRYRGAAGGGRCEYNVPSELAVSRQADWIRAGLEADRIFFNEMAPDRRIVLQGEYVADPRFGHCLHFSRHKTPMRDALKAQALNHLGPGCLLIIKAAMSPGSWDDFELLREKYPDSAIEFSCYSTFLGNVPRRNTIVWEVRNY